MRIEQLTFTRFIAAISIVIFHFGQKSYLIDNCFLRFIFRLINTNIGVSYFFILSGFVMIIAYENKSNINAIEYLKNRFARIYPVYLLAIIIIISIQLIDNNINFNGLFLNLFMLQAWIPGYATSFNFPGWSLSVELLFYIIFPFLSNKIYKKIKYENMIIPILSVWLISQISYLIFLNTKLIDGFLLTKTDLKYFPLMHLNEFLIGNLGGLYFIKKFRIQRNLDWQILVIIFLILLTIKTPVSSNFHNGLLAILFMPLIILICLNNGILTTIFSTKFFIFLGEISFGIYILQYPIWRWLNDYRLYKYFQINIIDNFTLIFFIRFFVLILLSSISYIFFETPIRKKIKNINIKPIL